MTEQLHKRLMDEQVGIIFKRYLSREMKTDKCMDLLGLKRRQFFEWVKRYRQNPDNFTVDYKREAVSRKISQEVEDSIIRELASEKRLIDDKTMPVWFYNYSYLKDQIWKKYEQEVSLPTIISRAKKTGFTSRNERRLLMIMRCQPTTLGN